MKTLILAVWIFCILALIFGDKMVIFVKWLARKITQKRIEKVEKPNGKCDVDDDFIF